MKFKLVRKWVCRKINLSRVEWPAELVVNEALVYWPNKALADILKWFVFDQVHDDQVKETITSERNDNEQVS